MGVGKRIFTARTRRMVMARSSFIDLDTKILLEISAAVGVTRISGIPGGEIQLV